MPAAWGAIWALMASRWCILAACLCQRRFHAQTRRGEYSQGDYQRAVRRQCSRTRHGGRERPAGRTPPRQGGPALVEPERHDYQTGKLLWTPLIINFRRNTALLTKNYSLNIFHICRVAIFRSRLVLLITSHLADVLWRPSGMASCSIRTLNY